MALARAVRTVKSVLFVCTGNICRSPIAEGIFRRLIGNRARIIKNALPSVLAFVEESSLVPPGAARTGSVYPGDDIAYPMQPQKSTSSPRIYGEALRRTDPEIFDAIVAEEKRQRKNIELIASENFTSHAVMEAQGSVLTNKYAEGYPRKRWYGRREKA